MSVQFKQYVLAYKTDFTSTFLLLYFNLFLYNIFILKHTQKSLEVSWHYPLCKWKNSETQQFGIRAVKRKLPCLRHLILISQRCIPLQVITTTHANIPTGGGQQRLPEKSITVHGITVELLPSWSTVHLKYKKEKTGQDTGSFLLLLLSWHYAVSFADAGYKMGGCFCFCNNP